MYSKITLDTRINRMTNVVIIIPAFIPSTIIGILKPLQSLERQRLVKIRVAVTFINHLNFKRDIFWSDIVIFCRNCEFQELELLYYAKKNAKKIIYELDDNFFEIPLKTDIGIYHRSVQRLHVVRRFIELSDEVRIYSSHLKKIIEQFTDSAKINLIKSYFDHDAIKLLTKDKKDKNQIRIAYPTGRIDDPALENIIFLAIRKIMIEYSDTVIFYIWRKSIPAELNNLPNLVKMEQSISYKDFIEKFYMLDIDIGLAPVLDHPFYWSKTNNKYREYAGCGISGVYSNVPPYSNSVKNKVNGILVENTIDNWYAGINILINDKNLRNSISQKSFLDTIQNYSFDSAIHSWKESFLRIEKLPLFTFDWPPYSRKIPILALLNFNDDAASKIISQQIFDSTALFKRSFLDMLSSFEKFLNSPFKNKYCAIFIIDDGTINFDMLEILQSHNKNKIFLIHKLNSKSISSISENIDNSKNYTFLLLPDDLNENDKMGALHQLDIRHLNFYDILTEKYSLNGNMAFFIDLIERSIIDSHISSKSFISKFLFIDPIKILNKFSRFKNIYKIITLYLLVRLGLKKF